MSDPRAILHRALLCAVLAGAPASVAVADGAGPVPAAAVGLPAGGQNGYT